MTPIVASYIGPYTYRVCWESPPDTTSEAEIDTDQMVIRIRPDLPWQRHRVLLMHEDLHGLFDLLGIDMTEEQVTLLAPALIDLLDRNPELVSNGRAAVPAEVSAGNLA